MTSTGEHHVDHSREPPRPAGAPLFAHLATIRPDSTPQVNPMWFGWDGEYLYFTNTTTRYKYRNVTQHPVVSVSINDPEQPYRYLEIRGSVERIDPDPEGPSSSGSPTATPWSSTARPPTPSTGWCT
ncbi:PPOX class F420-dependent oxidoreductase [Streptomyces sp. SM1P]